MFCLPKTAWPPTYLIAEVKDMSKVDSVLDKYSAKVYKNRKKHMVELEEETQEIDANRRTMPGMLTHRGCCYAGCKGSRIVAMSFCEPRSW